MMTWTSSPPTGRRRRIAPRSRGEAPTVTVESWRLVLVRAHLQGSSPASGAVQGLGFIPPARGGPLREREHQVSLRTRAHRDPRNDLLALRIDHGHAVPSPFADIA